MGNIAALVIGLVLATLFLTWLKPHKRSKMLGKLWFWAKILYKRLSLRAKTKCRSCLINAARSV